ncbi:unnamed protein product [Oppiella nova]|uniref:Uncharacterized protein n=1 Tax=Oppiella nova TaxID=334625 RepID=A0A7R9QJT1_9ACAR|nr:unnamed protein product [Oppiella nova]CAG2166720.1 unnamed protein product [Oppiella nova]
MSKKSFQDLLCLVKQDLEALSQRGHPVPADKQLLIAHRYYIPPDRCRWSPSSPIIALFFPSFPLSHHNRSGGKLRSQKESLFSRCLMTFLANDFDFLGTTFMAIDFIGRGKFDDLIPMVILIAIIWILQGVQIIAHNVGNIGAHSRHWIFLDTTTAFYDLK